MTTEGETKYLENFRAMWEQGEDTGPLSQIA